MAGDIQPSSSTTIATPNPEEFAVLVTVPSHFIFEGTQPRLGERYDKTANWMDKSMVSMGYGDYIFSMSKDGGGQTTQFTFGKNKNDRQSKDPLLNSMVPFHKSWKKFGNHRWAPILKNLTILTDNSFPRSANVISGLNLGIINAPVYFDRYVYIPDCNEGTRFFLEEFVGPEPYKIPRYRVPIATGIQYNIGNLSGGFQECLHDDVFIPTTTTGNVLVNGTLSGGGIGQEGQFFPATPFKTWLPYVLYDEQEQDKSSGAWYRQRIRVFPPLLPRAIRR